LNALGKKRVIYRKGRRRGRAGGEGERGGEEGQK